MIKTFISILKSQMARQLSFSIIQILYQDTKSMETAFIMFEFSLHVQYKQIVLINVLKQT